jgi:hypothetical protein
VTAALTAEDRARLTERLSLANGNTTANPTLRTWKARYREDVRYLLSLVDARAGTEGTTLAGDGPPSLFDPPVRPIDAASGTHRTPDHETSERAGLSDLGRRTSQRTAIARQFWRHPDGLTDEEAANAAIVAWRSAPWKRCTELRDGGWLEWTGELRPTSTGSPAKVWRMTAAGRVEADRLWGTEDDA